MENKRRTNIDPTVEYYEKNAAVFIESTINANVSDLYKPFEELLTPGCRILDLGCGSGRDSKYFAEKGYDVVALDPSSEMCAQTKKLVHIPVYEMRAEEMQFSNEFGGVWACASLLHVPRDKQKNVLHSIVTALKDEGILYASWKYGTQDRTADGKNYIDMNEPLMYEIINEVPEMHIVKMWTTEDVRNEYSMQKWLNVLLRKKRMLLAMDGEYNEKNVTAKCSFD